MFFLFFKSIVRLEKGKCKGLVNLGVARCVENVCDYPFNATENLAENFFLSRQSSVEESQEGCVMAEVFIAQQTFQDSLSDPRAKAWATQR